MTALETSQDSVRHWFDQVYATRGLSYLRPAEAYPIFIHLLGAKPGERLLDVACGAGLLLRAARERGLEAFGVDLSIVGPTMTGQVPNGPNSNLRNPDLLPYRHPS